MKRCISCNIDKPLTDWYLRKSGTALGRKCKECKRKDQREKSMIPEKRARRLVKQKAYMSENREKFKEYLVEYSKTKKGRAKQLLASAKKRGKTMGIDIDEAFVLELLDSENCSVTNIPFQYHQIDGLSRNPFSPSLDRIDSSRGYFKDNVRLVIWQYNLMKGEITDEQLYSICKEVVNARSGV